VKLRAGDVLGADALLELALAAAADPDAPFIYSDELRFDPAQARRQAFFKPDWSPTLLQSMNYIGRLWCAAASLVEAAGFSAPDLAAAADYEAVLRLTEHAVKIVHVPRILCSRGDALDTPELGVEILAVLHRLYPTQFQLDKSARLLCNQTTLEALKRGEDARTIAAGWKSSLDSFAAASARWRLYQ